jgi:glutamate N-acetyltransferase/amino-acid N-acetyltransferase
MSVTAPAGFAAAGIAAGIKPSGAPDLALVAAEPAAPVVAAATFTTNAAAAAPVQVSRQHLAATGGRAAAVVLNSGCANAATGEAGVATAERMCALAAEGLGVRNDEVLVCSTGLIGARLPVDPLESGVPLLVEARTGGTQAGAAAARAIMTTDTRPKETLVSAHGFVVGGMAKGAAMLAPNMATMLAVLTTDASVSPPMLRAALGVAVQSSFNELTVDGCTSTNDTVIVLASARAGEPRLSDLTEALTTACRDLARQMAADAEGATKVARVVVTGAADTEDARRAARRVAESQLVKCSLYGADPYWGRVVSELGSSGARFELDRVSVAYGPVTVCVAGTAVEHDQLDEEALARHMSGDAVEVRCDLGLGTATAEVVTTDLGPGYIDENRSTS